MKPPKFSFIAVDSVDDCLDELDSAPQDVKLIAGGQSLLPLMYLRFANPGRLVDINRIIDLDCVIDDGQDVVLGALVRHSRLTEDPEVAEKLPLLAEAAAHIGHVAIRNRGTLGGSLAHGDSAAELAAAMVLLRARMVCASARRGTRTVPAGEFFLGPYTTALEDDELLTSVSVPKPAPGTRHGFVEVSARSGDYARLGACCALLPDASGRLTGARAVLFGTATGRLELPAVENPPRRDDSGAFDWRALASSWAESAGDSGYTPAQRRLVRTVLFRVLTKAYDGGRQ